MKKATKKSAPSRKPKPLQDMKMARAYFKSMMEFSLGPSELRRRMQAGELVNVIDVRRGLAFAECHIPGSLSLPKDSWAEATGLSKDRINVLYCGTQQCHLAPEACLYFAEKGYPVMHLDGGLDAWKDYGYEVEAMPSSGEQPMSAEVAH